MYRDFIIIISLLINIFIVHSELKLDEVIDYKATYNKFINIYLL